MIFPRPRIAARAPRSTRCRPESRAAALAFLFFLGLLGAPLAAEGQDAGLGADGPVRRLSLSAGANDGGHERTRLRFAGSDAANIHRLLHELGGVQPGDGELLFDPDRSSLARSLERLRYRAESARRRGERVEVFFYYSGHADEESLLLGNERFDYLELRDALESMPAEVRVAVLDSCASGSLIRGKGIVRKPAFLSDSSRQVKGHAYLTASAASEAAQESDRIGASFFTHHLVSGLRGAAARDGSGRVTLHDAYRYAFDETLAQTERTFAGAQHPAYEFQLVGTGELVITDVRQSSAGLVLDEALAGRLFVRDHLGRLVVEVRKLPEAPVEIGLTPGAYVLTLQDDRGVHEARIELGEGGRLLVEEGIFTQVEVELTTSRGNVGPAEEQWEVVPFDFTLFPPLGTGPTGRPTLKRFSLYALAGEATKIDGAQIGLGVGFVDEGVEGVQVGLGANVSRGWVDGAQLGLGYNHAASRMEGAQLTLAANYTGGDMDGTQASLGANIAQGDAGGSQLTFGVNVAQGWMRGSQVSLVGNYAGEGASGGQVSLAWNYAGGDFTGIQSSLGVNVASGSVEVAQLGVAVNVAGGSFEGAQVAVGFNSTQEDFEGLQTAVGFNRVGGTMSGLQTAAGLSLADGVDGAQISGINVAGNVDGAQIGFINFAGKVDGTQIGLLNFASESDASIGLLSFVRNGRYALSVWHGDESTSNLGLKLGSRRVYSLLFGGLSPFHDGPGVAWTWGSGLGLHFPIDAPLLSYLDMDVSVRTLHATGKRRRTDRDFGLAQTLRIAGGWRVLGDLAIVAGPALHVSQQRGDYQEEVSYLPTFTLRDGGSDGTIVRLWPGFFLGLEI